MIITVNESFWPLFFTRRIVSKFIKESICFALHYENETIVFVYPLNSGYNLPTIEDIKKNFSKKEAGKNYLNSRDLPVNLQNFLGLAGVCVESFGNYLILYGVKNPGKLEFSDTTIMSIQLNEEIDDAPFPTDNKNYAILFENKFNNSPIVNYHLLIRRNAIIKFTKKITIESNLDEVRIFQMGPMITVYH